MDVTCERCQAEYEFDDALLGENGTTVKCSACAHVFRVAPKGTSGRASLKLRLRRSGQVIPLPSLRELQRRIHLGEVTIDDELGRDGFDWRRLGDVAELRGFFAASAVSSRPGALTVSQSSIPPGQRAAIDAANRTIQGVGPSAAQAAAPKPAAKPAPAASAAATVIGHPAPAVNTPVQPPAAAVRGQRLPSLPPAGPTGQKQVRGLYLSENEAPPARASAGAKTGAWLLAGAVVMVGAWLAVSIVAGKRQQAETTGTPAPAPAALPTTTGEPPAVTNTAPSAPAPTSGTATSLSGTASNPPGTAAASPSGTPASPSGMPAQAAHPGAAAAVPGASAAQPKAAEQAEKPAPEPAQGATKPPPKDEPAEPREATAGDSRPAGKREPKDYGGWVVQGDELLGRGDLAGAQRSYEQALTLRASGSEANAGLGAALLRAGKVEAAVTPLERASRNGYAEANISLGDAYDKLGKKEAAVSAYRGYLSRLPSGARAGYARKRIEALEGATGGPAEPPPSGTPTEPAAPPPPSDYRPAGELIEAQPPAAENP